MARITPEQLQRLQAFLDSLPDEAKSKCSICNTTLTHIVKQAEAETGVGTATVTRALAEKVNETALPADRVSGDQLRDRVRRSAGEKESGRTAQIKKPDANPNQVLIPEIVVERVKEIHKQKGVSYADAITEIAREEGQRPATVKRIFAKEMERKAYQSTVTQATQFAKIAILQLERIADDDPARHEAFNLVRTWMDAEEAACGK
ncbi:hypothetical protein [Desulfomicrobium escambiense]|uniref:hypothetical protein n=1 Tax=Desulfomicrobium escambiense TaxID=29503 RepID=UPI00048EBD01|nr:hypothetical protein [Desulfomicrobium escambiense]